MFGVGGIDGCHDNVTSLNWDDGIRCAVLTEGRLLGFEGSQAVGDREDHLPILSVTSWVMEAPGDNQTQRLAAHGCEARDDSTVLAGDSEKLPFSPVLHIHSKRFLAL